MSSSSDDETTTLRDRLVSTFPLFDRDTSFVPWVEAHQSELDALDVDVDAVQRSLQIAHAEGQSLDLIGADFGRFGLRRGRDDDEYRAYLQSLVPAFDGRGTNRDVRVAIAAGLAIDPEDDVALREDFEANTYEVELHDWTPHRSGTVRDMADLADPVAIPRLDPVHNILDETAIGIAPGETSIAEMYRAPEARIGISPGETTNRVAAVGLSAPTLGALSTDSWLLSIRRAPAATIGIAPGETIIREMTTASVATVGVDVGATVVRSMTRTATATVGVSPSTVDATTLATRGLSSGLLGGLSTTSMDQLA